jgi:hypothetical protein
VRAIAGHAPHLSEGGQSMSVRVLLTVAAIGCCLSGSGCSQLRCGCGNGCAQKSPYAGQTYDCCCETCGPNWGPSCAACRQRDECGCGSPGESSCAANACGNGCGGQGQHCRLLGALGCNGCGELYWSEWFNDPPACCEPCDCHGNYTGAGAEGYYRAPYLTHSEPSVEGPTTLPPLEVAPPATQPLADSQPLPMAPMPQGPAPGGASGAPPEPLPDHLE